MCGIVQGFSKKGRKINKAIMKRYEQQKSRGQLGYGYVAVYANNYRVGRSEDENGIRSKIMSEQSGMIMFHHRLPTSTPNLVEATHPIHISHDELDYDYFIVHNGVIRNAEELRKKHESFKVPYVYKTVITTTTNTGYLARSSGKHYNVSTANTEKFNDSEALAIEISRCLDGMKKTIDTVGNVAFCAYRFNKETKKLISIHWGHNIGNPLTLTDNNDVFIVASVGGKDIETDVLFTLDVSSGEITEKAMNIGYMTSIALDESINPRPTLPARTEYNYNHDKKLYEKIDRAEEYLSRVHGESSYNNWRDLTKEGKEKAGFELPHDSKKESFEKASEWFVEEYIKAESSLNVAEVNLELIKHELVKEGDLVRIKNLIKTSEEIEEKIDSLQGEMNDIEDMFMEDFGGEHSFTKLVDAYKEQQEQDAIAFEDDSRYARPYNQ